MTLTVAVFRPHTERAVQVAGHHARAVCKIVAVRGPALPSQFSYAAGRHTGRPEHRRHDHPRFAGLLAGNFPARASPKRMPQGELYLLNSRAALSPVAGCRAAKGGLASCNRHKIVADPLARSIAGPGAIVTPLHRSTIHSYRCFLTESSALRRQVAEFGLEMRTHCAHGGCGCLHRDVHLYGGPPSDTCVCNSRVVISLSSCCAGTVSQTRRA